LPSRGSSALGAICGLVFSFLSIPVVAQGPSATLRGVVWDETNALVPDVAVIISNDADGVQHSTTTDRNGSFVVTFLRPGRYTVIAKHEGFATAEVHDVVLNVNDQVAINVRLKIQGTGESVTVTAEPGKASTSSSVGTVVEGSFLTNIPLNGRSLQALLQSVPGVVLTVANGGFGATGVSQFSINGQRTTSNYFMVDGVSGNTGMSAGQGLPGLGSAGGGTAVGTTVLGGTNSLASLDAIQEFRIETSGYAPEFGHYAGGQVSLVTRSGSNNFHGSAAEYFRHDALDANDWFANSLNLPKARERQYIFSGVAGGPLKRNAVFFFVSYEDLNLRLPKTAIVAVPDAATRAAAPMGLQPYLNALPLANGPALRPGFAQFAATYSDPASSRTTALKLDGQIGSRLNTFFRVNHAPSTTETRADSLSKVVRLDASNNSFTGGGTWIASDRVTADVRANWTRNNPHVTSSLDSFGGAIVPSPRDIFLPGFSPENALFFFYGANFPGFIWGQGSQDVQRQLNVNGALSWFVSSHHIKGGFDIRRLTPLVTGGTGNSEQAYFGSASGIATGSPLFYTIMAVEPIPREPILTNLALFAQDSWQLGNRVTLNYGLRFERLAPPGVGNGLYPQTLQGIENGNVLNPSLAPIGTPLWRSRFGELAPRVGAVVRLRDSNAWSSVLRGGVGVFDDSDVGRIIDEFASAYPFQASRNVRTPVFPPDAALRIPPTLPSLTSGGFYALDPDFRMPYATQWNLSLEQAVPGNQTVTISYVGAASHRLLAQQIVQTTLPENPAAALLLLIDRNAASSTYHALQLQLQRRLTHGLALLASYTLGSARDNASASDSQAATNVASLLDKEWGPSDFDVRHVASGALTYQFNGVQPRTFFARALNSCGIDVLLRAQSAPPVNLTSKSALIDSATIYRVRPDIVPGQSFYITSSLLPGGRKINAAAFTKPIGNQGTFLRNDLRGFAASQIDLAIHREISFTQAMKVQLRAELFNALNHPNFGPPVPT
jgi:hypothetical protein